jgi:hypothetical protein
MKEGQTQQCPKEKEQNDNDPQNMTYKTKDRVTRTLLKTIGDFSVLDMLFRQHFVNNNELCNDRSVGYMRCLQFVNTDNYFQVKT